MIVKADGSFAALSRSPTAGAGLLPLPEMVEILHIRYLASDIGHWAWTRSIQTHSAALATELILVRGGRPCADMQALFDNVIQHFTLIS